ncbi:MAG: isoprenylcysteine carboxylmethyltransferase family protein [Prolixibacteraceae bacterium]
MMKILFFALLSVPVVVLSLRSIFSYRNHGFYRFFGWEGVLWLLVSNVKFWFEDPFGPKQVISWFMLFVSLYYLIVGGILLIRLGKPQRSEERKELFQFEKTTELIQTGLFGWIRHPLYGSLILLTWGIFLKNCTVPLLIVALLSTLFFYLTALYDEKECIQFFGEKYRTYMKHTKMFIPFVW